MQLSKMDDALWLIGFAGQALLVLTLIWKRKTTQFPFFSSLIVFGLARGCGLFTVHAEPRTYFYAYWSLSFMDAILQLLVFREIAGKLFRPDGSWSRDVARPLVCTALISLCIAACLAWLSDPPGTAPVTRFVVRGQLLSTMLMAELFAGLVVLSVTSGFVWRSYTGVIARGLGVYSVCSLLVQGVQHYIGLSDGGGGFRTLAHIQSLCLIACLAYWIIGLTRSAPLTQPLPHHLKLQLARFDAFMNIALVRLRSDRVSS